MLHSEHFRNCKTEKEFRKIWNTDKFEWNGYSDCLAMYCSEYFHIWWDTDKFYWKFHSDLLAEYCNDYFNIWWDENKFNWIYSASLLISCQKYKHIWQTRYIIEKLKRNG